MPRRPLTKRFAVTLPIAFVLLFHSASSCRTSPDSQVANRLQAYLKPFVDPGNFTGCVLVASKSRVLFRRSYGMANYGCMFQIHRRRAST